MRVLRAVLSIKREGRLTQPNERQRTSNWFFNTAQLRISTKEHAQDNDRTQTKQEERELGIVKGDQLLKTLDCHLRS